MAFDLRLSILLVWTALLTGMQASPSLIVGEWALENFSMACPGDGHSCEYSFQIIEGVGPGDEPDGQNSTGCAFTIESLGVPATLLNFTSQPCDGSDAYRVNGGWDPLGFITLCVSHASEDAWAFFGYESWQVVNTNATWKNRRPAYKMFTFNGTDEVQVSGEGTKRGASSRALGGHEAGVGQVVEEEKRAIHWMDKLGAWVNEQRSARGGGFRRG